MHDKERNGPHSLFTDDFKQKKCKNVEKNKGFMISAYHEY
jgi:hypothetical protein